MRIRFALGFLKDMVLQAKLMGKKIENINLKKENELLSLDDYENIAKEEYDLFEIISDIEKINERMTDLKSARQRISAKKEQMSVFKPFEIKFSQIKNTKNTVMFAGTISAQKAEEFFEENKDKAYIKIYEGNKLIPLIVICHKDNAEEIKTALASCDFVKASYEYDATAQEKIGEYDRKLEEIESKRQNLVMDALQERHNIKKFKILYDYYYLEKKKLEVLGECASSQKTFLLEAWIPKHRQQEIAALIEKKCKYAEAVFREPYDNETPPTLTHNNKLVDPVVAITNMYGAPNYRELDPNIFVAIFYLIIFGFMFSDAGYGVVLAVSCFAYYFIKKPVKRTGRMILLFGLGGVSTVIWGAIFGGWFGLTFPKEPLINPLDPTGSIIMFGMSLGIGALQIAVGFALNGINRIRRKEVLQGIFEDFGWVIIIIGLLLVVSSMLMTSSVLNLPGIIIALIGTAMLLLSGAIGKKNPIKMVGGALGKAYGSINVVSDLLSYSRLFGLGLTTGVIGYVVNQFAVVIVGFFPPAAAFVGWLFALPVLLVGHLFNFGINLLGVYVHNSRLQYIEFFQRFYEGSGHIFTPLGSQTKYTYLDN